jgi:hypothetical protein
MEPGWHGDEMYVRVLFWENNWFIVMMIVVTGRRMLSAENVMDAGTKSEVMTPCLSSAGEA